MRRRKSNAWEEIGYTVPDESVVNAQAQLARRDDRAALRKRQAEAEERERLRNSMVPADRTSVFAAMHAAIDAAASK
jgi:hypothetical protein